jgi:hypothetical protein
VTRPAEQVPVPTNGKGPGMGRGLGHVPESPPGRLAPPLTRATIDVTPAQLAVGFGIIASIVLLVARSLRRRRSGR